MDRKLTYPLSLQDHALKPLTLEQAPRRADSLAEESAGTPSFKIILVDKMSAWRTGLLSTSTISLYRFFTCLDTVCSRSLLSDTSA